MVATVTPDCNTGWKAPGFDLPGVDGQRHSLDSLRGEHGTLVMFLCNHCPYVKAVLDRIVRDANDLAADGIACLAISSNDVSAYPADSFDNMKRVAAEKNFPFPYLYDESQEVARAFGAVCTPDFFGLNADDELCYRGRLDESRTEAVPDANRDLFEAMRQVARTGKGPDDQIASIGCSIKWRDDA